MRSVTQVWVPIPGTCRNNPYDSCREVSKTKERQVVETQYSTV